MKYVKKQLKGLMERFYSELKLFKRRFIIRFRKFKVWMKKNWVSVALDSAVIIVAAFVGLLIGGFIGFLFVIKSLVGV